MGHKRSHTIEYLQQSAAQKSHTLNKEDDKKVGEEGVFSVSKGGGERKGKMGKHLPVSHIYTMQSLSLSFFPQLFLSHMHIKLALIMSRNGARFNP